MVMEVLYPALTSSAAIYQCLRYSPLLQNSVVGWRPHIWELLGNYPVLTVVMVIYHYVDRIWRILVTPDFLYNIYDHE